MTVRSVIKTQQVLSKVQYWDPGAIGVMKGQELGTVVQ